MKYIYFVFGESERNCLGVLSSQKTNLEVTRDTPLDSVAQISELEKDICKRYNYYNFLIQNFQLLRTEEE